MLRLRQDSQRGRPPYRVRVRRALPRALHRRAGRSEEHTSELQSRLHLVCRLLLEKKKKKDSDTAYPNPDDPSSSAHLHLCQDADARDQSQAGCETVSSHLPSTYGEASDFPSSPTY